MRILKVSAEVYDTVQLLAKALGTTEDGALRRLIEEYRPKPAHETEPAGRPVHAVYDGNRIEGRYHPETEKVVITSEPLAGLSFKSPSGAAIAVVRHYRPEVNPNRNGWSFWTLTENGQLLNSIRERP